MRTRIAILGAGPAGLMLAQLLRRAGVDCMVIEAASREHVERRLRAGVLEPATADLLEAAGVGERMRCEGMVHSAIDLRFGGRDHRIDLAALTGGHRITVYGQQEVVKDLIAARLAAGDRIDFGCEDVRLEGFLHGRPRVRYRLEGREEVIDADFIAGCDGFHGASRAAIPPDRLQVHEHAYPFAWLGVLVEAAPNRDALVYTHHDGGFALYSMRSPSLTRLYLQVPPETDLAAWDDARVWEGLRTRFAGGDGWMPREGRIVDRGLAAMRSVVIEPMQAGRLFLAGDAAHIVPPTGAKGLNLAIADVAVLAQAFVAHFAGDARPLEAYSATCLARVWRVQQFSWWMTALLHRFPEADAFQRRLQQAQLAALAASTAARTWLAENYVGLPSKNDDGGNA